MRLILLLSLILFSHRSLSQQINLSKQEEESKLKQHVLSNPLITLSSDTVLVNNLPTLTMETIITDEEMLSIEIPSVYDSMILARGKYNGTSELVPIDQVRCRGTSTTVNTTTGLTTERLTIQLSALFITAYQQGKSRIFCRIIRKNPKK